MMERILILVEGQTEETFVRDVLVPYFQPHNKILIPKLVVTKRLKNGYQFKGGVSQYSKIRKDLLRLLNDTNAKAVTTLLDYYGLPGDFPGKQSLPHGTCYMRVNHLQDEFGKNINHRKFIPFLTLHEFEAFLFSSLDHIANVFPDLTIANQLDDIMKSRASPEEINEGNDTHPSARMERIIPPYRKALHGPIIAGRIGLRAIRSTCTHFASWLETLEKL